jgi:predicted N-acetyltransferase YhbS
LQLGSRVPLVATQIGAYGVRASMTLAFRLLDPSDAEAAAALIRAAFAAQDAVTDPPSSALKETAEIVLAKLAAGGGVAALAGGELVALALFQPDTDALYIGRLAVAPSRRGQGLAGRLLALCEDEARLRNFARTRLRVRLDLDGNRRLFERRGYRETAQLAHPGYERPTFAVMEKPLSP